MCLMVIDLKTDYSPRGRQNNAPFPAPPYSNPWNLGLCSAAWQRGLEFAGGMKVANPLNLQIGRALALFRWVQCHPKGPYIGRGRQKMDSLKDGAGERFSPPLLA